MRILEIFVDTVKIPLKRPFKTALRTTQSADDIVIRVIVEGGIVGWGSAAPTIAITGESQASISFMLSEVFKPICIGKSLEDAISILENIDTLVARNTSAKAALSIAFYDALAKSQKQTLAEYLGATNSFVETDITISIGSVDDMVKEALEHVSAGYKHLKVKVGLESEKDLERIRSIRKAIGHQVAIRVDANQGWTVAQAIKNIRALEDDGTNIEFIEQPVKSFDLEGMSQIKKHISTKLVADESVFSVHDAKRILDVEGADIINVKLMKAGGVQNALKIFDLAKKYNADCMMSCMLESKIGIAAAASLALAMPVVKYIDLDAASLAAIDVFEGGPTFLGNKITLSSGPGLGISDFKN